jgi:hypothetical protein
MRLLERAGIPVVDLFEGPGGLSEGFAAVETNGVSPQFEVRLSIEKDLWAHSTLRLRTFFRQFPKGRAPDAYYDHLRGTITLKELFDRYPREAETADTEAWHAALGEVPLSLGTDSFWLACEVTLRISRCRDSGRRTVCRSIGSWTACLGFAAASQRNR